MSPARYTAEVLCCSVRSVAVIMPAMRWPSSTGTWWMLWRAMSSKASKAGFCTSMVMGASVAMSMIERPVSMPAAMTRLRRSRSVIRPKRWSCSTISTEDTRFSLMTCAASRMLVCGGKVMGARLISARTGVVIRLSAGSVSMPALARALRGRRFPWGRK
ncbi:hypothetical protein Y695_03340 [Hydrogenophaga sp. T4]|nr:hypothetical protein Y695_03340 [Hydrogenophaga sp. T4]